LESREAAGRLARDFGRDFIGALRIERLVGGEARSRAAVVSSYDM
jgi:hypothetical protein